MTADSIPISRLGQAGIVQLGRDSTTYVFSVDFIICIYVYLSLINEKSQSRHAPLVLQPTSKPGRPLVFIISHFMDFGEVDSTTVFRI